MGDGSLEQRHEAALEVARITQNSWECPSPGDKLAERGKERVEVLRNQTRPEVVHTLLFTFHWPTPSQQSHLTSRESGEGSGLSLMILGSLKCLIILVQVLCDILCTVHGGEEARVALRVIFRVGGRQDLPPSRTSQQLGLWGWALPVSPG